MRKYHVLSGLFVPGPDLVPQALNRNGGPVLTNSQRWRIHSTMWCLLGNSTFQAGKSSSITVAVVDVSGQSAGIRLKCVVNAAAALSGNFIVERQDLGEGVVYPTYGSPLAIQTVKDSIFATGGLFFCALASIDDLYAPDAIG